MRHGEAEHNVKNILSSDINNPHHLTEKGIEETKKATKELKNKKIDIIFASPLMRTTETAEIVSDELSINVKDIIYDERIREHDFGNFNGQNPEVYNEIAPSLEDKFTKATPNGENLFASKTEDDGFYFRN